jgi:hypothetical protein
MMNAASMLAIVPWQEKARENKPEDKMNNLGLR